MDSLSRQGQQIEQLTDTALRTSSLLCKISLRPPKIKQLLIDLGFLDRSKRLAAIGDNLLKNKLFITGIAINRHYRHSLDVCLIVLDCAHGGTGSAVSRLNHHLAVFKLDLDRVFYPNLSDRLRQLVNVSKQFGSFLAHVPASLDSELARINTMNVRASLRKLSNSSCLSHLRFLQSCRCFDVANMDV